MKKNLVLQYRKVIERFQKAGTLEGIPVERVKNERGLILINNQIECIDMVSIISSKTEPAEFR